MAESPTTATADGDRQFAMAISNATRIVPNSYPQTTIIISDRIADIPVQTHASFDNMPPAGAVTPRRGKFAELASLKAQSIFFVSG